LNLFNRGQFLSQSEKANFLMESSDYSSDPTDQKNYPKDSSAFSSESLVSEDQTTNKLQHFRRIRQRSTIQNHYQKSSTLRDLKHPSPSQSLNNSFIEIQLPPDPDKKREIQDNENENITKNPIMKIKKTKLESAKNP